MSEWFGSALSIDGDVLAVGVPRDDALGVPDAGSMYLCERDLGGPDVRGAVLSGREATAWANGGFLCVVGPVSRTPLNPGGKSTSLSDAIEF